MKSVFFLLLCTFVSVNAHTFTNSTTAPVQFRVEVLNFFDGVAEVTPKIYRLNVPANTTIIFNFTARASGSSHYYLTLTTWKSANFATAFSGVTYLESHFLEQDINAVVSGTNTFLYDVRSVHQTLPASFTVPIIGVVATPTWAQSSVEAFAFFLGFCFSTGVRIFRAARRWFARAGTEEFV